MAKGGVIGNLRVNMGMDSAQFQAGMQKASKSLDAMAKKAEVFGKAVGLAMTAAAGAMAYAVGNVINKADQLGYVADRLGVTIESLQELRYAAERSGVGIQTFDVALRRFIRRASEAALGTGAAKDAFKDLGVSLTDTDGKLKNSERLFHEVADALRGIQNPADRLRIAFKLFDTDGAAMVNMLMQGSDGIKALREEAQQLGIVLSDDAVRGAQAFKNNLDLVGKAKDGLVTKITAHLLPSLELLSEKFVGFVNDEAMVQATAEGMGKAFQWIARQAAHLAILIDRLRAEIMGLAEAGRRLKDLDFSGAWAAWTEGQDASARMRDELNATLEQMEAGFVHSQGQIQRRISAAFGDAGAQSAENFAVQFEQAVKGGSGKIKNAIDPMIAEAARIFESTRTPLERYQAQIARLNELLAAGAINQDTYNRAVAQAQDAFTKAEEAGNKAQNTFQQIGQSIAWTFSSAFQGLIDGSKKVKDVLKDLLSQLSNMLMNSAFQMLFGSGKGGLFGGGGGSIFGGIGKLLGFKDGGSFTVGGSGGTDSQLVAFRATPGEMVDVRKGNQARHGGAVAVQITGTFVDDNGVIKGQIVTMGQQAAQAGAQIGVSQVKQQMPGLIANAQARSM